MHKALFIGLSAAFFTAYSLVASALLIPTSEITPITNSNTDNCEDAGFIVLPGDPCYEQSASSVPFIGDLLAGASNIISTAGDLFGGFFQLITFQAGLPAASLITLLIFVPLGFINGFIIYLAIRGSS